MNGDDVIDGTTPSSGDFMNQINDADEDSGDFFADFSNIKEDFGEQDSCGIEEVFVQVAIQDVGSEVQTFSAWPDLLENDQVDLIYEDALYSILHVVGSVEQFSSEDFFGLLQKIFGFTQEKHLEILDKAQSKPAPRISVRIDVEEARNLPPKDVNGLSDPFCVMYLVSSKDQQQNTTMKNATLDPVWNERFYFLAENVHEDSLCVEVWDFDPDESVSDKVSRFGEIKGCKGFGKLLREIAAVSKTSGKTSHEFLGNVTVPLTEIPMAGLKKWFPLQGRDKSRTKHRGEIKMRLRLFPAEENETRRCTAENVENYEKFLKVLVSYKLQSNADWRGELDIIDNVLLHQVALHQNIRQAASSVIYWTVLCSVLRSRTLDFQMMYTILENNRKVLEDPDIHSTLDELFCEASKQFYSSALHIIRHIHSNEILSESPEQLQALLNGLVELNRLDLLKNGEDGPLNNFKNRIEESITMSAADRFSRAAGERKNGGPISDDDRTENAVRVIQHLVSDLKRASKKYNEPFCTILQIPYYSLVYQFYDAQVASLCSPVVKAITRSLKNLDFSEEQLSSAAFEASGEALQIPGTQSNPKLTMGTALFELYMALKEFHKLSLVLADSQRSDLKLIEFHTWFSAAVARWLEIALYKALVRTGKAVSMDTFVPIDSLVNHSTSAVDVVSVFYQIRTFWQQLSWPDPEGAIAFITKLTDDICRCSVFYATVAFTKLQKLDNIVNGRFHVTEKVCCAVNDVLYVRNSISPLVESLGISSLQEQLGNRTENSRTVDSLVENALENIDSKLEDVFQFITNSIGNEVLSFLEVEWDSPSGLAIQQEFIQYLDQNLITLNSRLDPETFQKILERITDNVMCCVLQTIQVDAEKKQRRPLYFQHWNDFLKILLNFFHGSSEPDQSEIVAKIRHFLKLYASGTTELIQQYYLERMNQTSEENRNLGSLSVRALFVGDQLIVEVINGRDLPALDSSGSSDPFVKISLIPAEKFGQQSQKTKVHKRTLFPLFDEVFNLDVPSSFHLDPDSLLLFTVKDHDIVGADDLIGETFLGFQSITRGDDAADLHQMEQIHLNLSRPSERGSVYMEILEMRSCWDKTAKDFVKHQKKFLEN